VAIALLKFFGFFILSKKLDFANFQKKKKSYSVGVGFLVSYELCFVSSTRVYVYHGS
jgi:hypothetical protein